MFDALRRLSSWPRRWPGALHARAVNSGQDPRDSGGSAWFWFSLRLRSSWLWFMATAANTLAAGCRKPLLH
jgi:hypothetical protein